jgi:hypothetical protein
MHDFRYGLQTPPKFKNAMPSTLTSTKVRSLKPLPNKGAVSVKYISDEYYNLLEAAPTKPKMSLNGLGEVAEPRPWYKHPLVIAGAIGLVAFLIFRKKG